MTIVEMTQGPFETLPRKPTHPFLVCKLAALNFRVDRLGRGTKINRRRTTQSKRRGCFRGMGFAEPVEKEGGHCSRCWLLWPDTPVPQVSVRWFEKPDKGWGHLKRHR